MQYPTQTFAGLALLAAVSASACGTTSSGVCVEIRESEDPQSSMHVIADEGYAYLTHPPTSGPHASGPTPSGLLAQPLANAVQVRILEAGGIIVQYRDDLSAADGDALAILGTVAAPDPSLGDAFVATAWTWKLTCESLDVDEVSRFARQRGTAAPGVD